MISELQKYNIVVFVNVMKRYVTVHAINCWNVGKSTPKLYKDLYNDNIYGSKTGKWYYAGFSDLKSAENFSTTFHGFEIKDCQQLECRIVKGLP